MNEEQLVCGCLGGSAVATACGCAVLGIGLMTTTIAVAIVAAIIGFLLGGIVGFFLVPLISKYFRNKAKNYGCH